MSSVHRSEPAPISTASRLFVDPWDAWLQRGIERSQDVLGEDWLPAYLQAPLWRFGLVPGICGEHGATGVLMPSVDRVGRYLAAPRGRFRGAKSDTRRYHARCIAPEV